MTIIEKVEMYKDKKVFVDNISKAFEAELAGSTVKKVEYEVYTKEFDGTTYFEEYIVVTYNGGAKAVRNATGNSNTANFRTIGGLVNGGYYDEVERYINLENNGYERVAI